MVNKITLFLALLISFGCSGTGSMRQPSQKIKDQRLVTDFTDEGIKVYYTLMGKLEKIEVYGQADAWKENVEAIAEADAMAKLVKFVYGSEVTTNRKLKLLGRAIEDAEDNLKRNVVSSEDAIFTTDKQLNQEINNSKQPNTNSESAQRKAKILNETLIETLTTIAAKGKLIGVRKVGDHQTNDNKVYVAVYQWSERELSIVESVRERMNKKPE
jgi:hypothetical protein